MTCNSSVGWDTIYVVFSPNEFAKANSNNVEELLPQELPFEEFQKWLSKGKVKDKEMRVLNKIILIEYGC